MSLILQCSLGPHPLLPVARGHSGTSTQKTCCQTITALFKTLVLVGQSLDAKDVIECNRIQVRLSSESRAGWEHFGKFCPNKPVAKESKEVRRAALNFPALSDLRAEARSPAPAGRAPRGAADTTPIPKLHRNSPGRAHAAPSSPLHPLPGTRHAGPPRTRPQTHSGARDRRKAAGTARPSPRWHRLPARPDPLPAPTVRAGQQSGGEPVAQVGGGPGASMAARRRSAPRGSQCRGPARASPRGPGSSGRRGKRPQPWGDGRTEAVPGRGGDSSGGAARARSAARAERGPRGRTRPWGGRAVPSAQLREPGACHRHRPLVETDSRAAVCLQEINGFCCEEHDEIRLPFVPTALRRVAPKSSQNSGDSLASFATRLQELHHCYSYSC